MSDEALASPDLARRITERLAGRSIVFVGLMGAGKTVIGRRVAHSLGLPFHDSDDEIEEAARMTIPEIFAHYGEDEFRALEQRVIARMMKGGSQVVSTGGGAFMNAGTRNAIAEAGVSVWLRAELDVLMERVAKRPNRPLLKTDDPRAVMERLMRLRYPVYAEADLTVPTRDERREIIAGEVLDALDRHLEAEQSATGRIA